MKLGDALQNIHMPQSPELLQKAQFRLKFEELFYIQLKILRLKYHWAEQYEGFNFSQVGELFT